MPYKSKTKKQLIEEIRNLEEIIAGYKNEAVNHNTVNKTECGRKLGEDEFHFSEAQRIAKIGSFEFYLDDSSQKLSDEYYRIFERDTELKEFPQDEFMKIVHPEDRENLLNNMTNYFLKKQKIDFEYRIVLPGGRIKYLYSICQPVTDDSDNVVKVVGIVQDITKQKLTEIENENYRNHLESLVNIRTSELTDLNSKLEQEVFERELITESLKESEERWQYAVEGSDYGIWDWDIAEKKIHFSERWRQIMEVQNLPLTGEIEDWYKLVYQDDLDKFKEELNRHLRGETPQFSVEHRLICKSGNQKWLYVKGKVMICADGNPVRMLGTIQDFTERKKTEDALSWELEVNSALTEFSSILLSKESMTFEEIADLVLNISRSLSKSKFGFVGYIDPNTGYFNVPTLTSNIFPSVKLEQQVIFREYTGLWGWVLKNKKPLIVNEVKTDPRSSGTPAGHIEIKRFISTPVLYGGELLGQISLANSDFAYSEKEMELLNRLASLFALVIQRKRSLDALQESEKFLQSTLDALPAHIAILDNNGTILAVNKQWKSFADNNKFHGVNYGLGINYLEVCKNAKGPSSHGAKEVYNGIQNIVLNKIDKFELEYPCHSLTEKRWFIIKANRFQGEGGIKLVVTHENITARKEAEKKVKSQNSFLRNILQSLTYPFFVVDANDFKVRMANQAAMELYDGMLEGCFCFSVSNLSGLCGGHNQSSCIIETVKTTKQPAVLEREIKDKLGNVRTFSVHGYPVINSKGDVVQIIEYCIDITEKRNTEMKLLLQSAALESADNAIVITDFDGNITWVNAAFSLLTGYSFDEAVGNQPRILKSGIHQVEFYNQMWETVKAGRVWRGELINKRKNGEFFTEEMTITPVRQANDNITHFIAIKQDVSDRKKAEQEIKETLEKEKELNVLRSRFVSTISHEFRTPLTSILASAELLERYNERWTKEKKIEILKRIQTSVDYMEDMLGDVLTINKADSGKFEFNPRPLKIVEFCMSLIEEVRLTAKMNHVISFTNHCNENLIVKMDEKLLRHIISNLLSNSVKYSPYGGSIELIINIEEEVFSVTVKDNGIGISEEDQNKLFEPFFRGSNISGISGTGLGLSILKRAVDLHNGMIFFESKVGMGTTFYIKLPLKY